ncbi:pentapeptide repeat-containing protein [Aetokthonos hydrillicola Thurmond2011]|jgi:uncharacterized protein YjbI with pentapeptide repeats|uniref:Pentapeptide repeat-containing protein n=1 Tax=Aetokthonos hydrillicola Thurmond2011 TaxID=2712845 RepID=A0AAP5MD86_9CYAN|nr:pentapeptide repeat-containing protein [Aetokthonos hydrillicola]MBO3461229.1 hypothetical protein [Aetokthonos hydrillicola CCALA 1050]MBW4591042.1 pentapeptide repeat-containing protein [Aetokthonos hydrillicola CCALA 1050]MDR9900212.1 pentapeptide repeat-containing protein [Aetokthonos hydrillicola Thurmond2011]
MSQDFSGQNLRGRSFKDQDLTEANFSGADIRSTDFSGANLEGANFSQVKAGLQKRWTAFLVLVSWLMSGFAGFLSTFVGVLISHASESSEIRVSGWTALIVVIVVFIVIIRQGLNSAIAVAVAVAVAFAIAVAFVIAVVGGLFDATGFVEAVPYAVIGAVVVVFAFAFAIAIAIAVAIAFAVAGNFAFAVAVVFAVVFAVVGNFAFATTGVGAIAFAGAVAFVLLSIYISWRALKGDEKYVVIHNIAVAIAAIGGTSFRDADLTDADFTSATLKNTDFRKANLTRTCFHKTKKLDRVRPGSSYLQNTELRQLLITGNGQGKNFKNKIFQGVNLSKANFSGADLINTNFYKSSLKEADLEGALLVRAQFESVDLTEAKLTGACIQDWVVTKTTKLHNVKCKYIFMKLSEEGDKRDQMPPKGEFKNDDFVLFVQSILDTIKLYHERDVNPNLALYVLQSLSVDYQCTLEIVKVEKRGESGAIIEVKVPGNLNEEQLKETYYEKYNQSLRLYMTDPKKQLKSPTNIENVTVHKGILISGDVNNSPVTIDNQGDTIMPEGSKQQFNNDLRNAQFAGGLVNADTVAAHQIGGNITNHNQQQNLAEAAAEIQQLLQQLEQTNPTTTTSEKMTVVAKAVDEIEKNPTLKARVIGALKSGGKEALKEAIDHPLVNILIASIEGWQEAE